MEEKELIKQLEATNNIRTLTNQQMNQNYYHKKFLPLLKLGQLYEDKATERIVKHFKYKRPHIEKCNNKNYDVKIEGYKYEVKLDVKATTTDNIFIEFIQNGKPSGIATTKAHFYIIVLPYEAPIYLLIDVNVLNKLIDEHQFKRIFQPGPHNNFTGGYLFCKELIIKHSILV